MSISVLSKPADFVRLIELSEKFGPHLAEFLRPASLGKMNLVFPTRDTRMPPLHQMEKKGRPVAVILGDDDYRPAGPGNWACACKLRSWARFAIVHGASAERQHYAAAAAMTLQVRRMLFIETSSVGAQAWAAFLSERTPLLPMLGILPTDGPHPVLPPRGAMH